MFTQIARLVGRQVSRGSLGEPASGSGPNLALTLSGASVHGWEILVRVILSKIY